MICGRKEMWEFDLKDWFWWLLTRLFIFIPFFLFGFWFGRGAK